MDAQVDPRYITLDSTGGGSVYFRSGVPGSYLQISKVAIETQATGSGTVALYYKGQLVTSKALALLMAAAGLLNLAPGEELEARFTNGPANAQVKVTSHFVQAPQPAAERGLAFTEAVGFAAPIDNPVQLFTCTDEPIDVFGDVDTGIMDVRAYNSWFARFDVSPAGAAPVTEFDPLMIRVRFYSDPSGAAEFRTFLDTFLIYPTDGFTFSGALFLTDQMHGPYMTLEVMDFSILGRSSELDLNLYGSYRQMPGPYIRVDDSGFGAGVLYETNSNINAGSTRIDAAALGYGPASLMIRAPAGVTATVVIAYAGQQVGETITVVGGAAAVFYKTVLTLPKAQVKFSISHNSGVAQRIETQLIQQLQPY